MKGKIVGLVLFVFLILNMFIFFQEEVEAASIDYIVLTDAPNGTALATVVLPVGGNVTAYASAYNFTTGYIGLAYANWWDLMGLGTLDNSSGTSTTFTAGMSGGLTTILGENTSFINDTFNITILNPTIDYIEITDTPGGTPLSGGIVPPNYEEWGNCSAYNNTAGYLYTVSADWYVDGGDPILLGPTPAHGNGINVGTILWYKFLNASFGGHTDGVQYLISIQVDYIKITDTPNGTELVTVDLPVGGQVTAYASAYNISSGYIGLADVNWYELMGLGTLDNSFGTSTTFTAGMSGGLTTILGEYTSTINDTFNVSILNPTIDYIVLTDSSNGTELTTVDLFMGGQITIYASGYNNTAGYIALVVVDWLQTPTRGSFTNLTGTSTTFTASGPPSLCTITGSNASWSDDFVVNILSPTIDYIEITDTPNGTALLGGTVAVGYQEMGYCSAYNSSHGYIGLMSADWTAQGGNSYLLNSTPGDMNGINVGTMGATVWFNANWSGHTDSVQYTVTPPTVDYVRITDTPGGTPIPDRSVQLGFQEWGNCSSYNNTAGYIGTVNADWLASGGSSFLLGPTPAHGNGIDVGTSEVTVWFEASYGGYTDKVIYTVINMTIDYLEITDTPNGTPLTGGTVSADFQEYAYSSAYNNTFGYINTVLADWTAEGGNAFLLNSTPTTFNGIDVGNFPGLVWLNISYDGHTDSVQYNVVANWTVDYILITYTPNGTEIEDKVVPVGYEEWGNCSAYNNTAGYLYTVSADWYVSGVDPTLLGPTPAHGNGINVGTFLWYKFLNASYGGHTDSVQYLVSSLTVDYIQIRDAAGGLGNEVANATYWVYELDEFYAASYNNTAGYLWDVTVDWESDNPSVGQVNTPGLWTNFTAQMATVDGTCIVTATYQSTYVDTTGLLTVLAPRVDYLLLTDWAHENGTEIPDMDWNVSEPLPIFASGYNNSLIGPLYIGPVEVNWTDTPDRGDFNNLTGTSTIFTGNSAGLTTIKGENQTLGLSDDFQLNLQPLPGNVDFIINTDSPNGTALGLVTLPVGGQITAYASGYNISSGYVGLVVVNWSDSPDLGSFDNPIGSFNTFTAGFMGGSTTITGQNNTLGVSDIFTVNILPPTIDSIILTDAPNGTELTTVILNTGEHVTAYASSYNATSGYIGFIEVNWSESAGLGSLDNLTGTSSKFTAGASSGLTTITGQNDTLGLSDTFDVNINPPSLDYINITDAPNGSSLTTVILEVYGQVTAYASGYNYSVGYFGLIEVNWSESAGLGSFDNPIGTSVTFTAGAQGGLTTITGENATLGKSDSFDVYVLPPEVDNIILTDSPNGTMLTLVTINVGESTIVYASAYNDTSGYIGLINVNWSESAGLGTLDNTSGTSTTFTADLAGGSTTITGVNLSEGVSDSFDVYINPPEVDYVLIRTLPGGGGINLCNPANYTSYPVGATDTFYGAMYNHTAGYFDDVPINATWLSSDNSIVMVTSPGSSTDLTCDDHNWGTVTITLSTSGLQNTTQVTVVEPQVDYIQIRDAPNGLGIIITNRTYVVWQVDEFYAAAYNNTADYLFDVEAAWSSDDTSVGTVTAIGLWTNFTAQKVDIDGVCHVTALYDGISDSTGALTVLAPRIDSIVIMSSSNGSGDWIADRTYNEGDNDIFWVAGFNNTADYVKDIKATWESNNTEVGMVTSGPSEYTNFTAGWKGGYCRITASYDTLTNQTGTLFVINVNTLPTAEADYYNGTGFSGGNFTFSSDITVRVTGRKQNIVTMKLEEDGVIVDEVVVIRQSGQPDIGQISYEMNVQKVYRIVLIYNGNNGGSNPLIVTFEFLGNIYSVHLLFNSQDGTGQEAIIKFNDIVPLVGVVFFDASSSSDFEGYLVDYQWNFGDGTEGSGETLAHTFEENDVYIVTLTVTDDEEGTDSSTITVPVENIDNNNQANAIPGQKGAKGFLNDSGECIVILQCPADMLITNNMGNQIGLSNGIPVDDIEGAFVAMSYSDIEVYYIPINDSFTVEVDGTGRGLYNLTVILVDNDITKKYAILDVSCTESTLDVYIFDFRNEEISISTNEDDKLYSLEFSESVDDQRSLFILSDMRLDKETTHIYRINDWGGLSSKKSVTLFIDKDSDGIYDKKVDLETGLSGEEVDALLLKRPVAGPVFPIMFFVIIGSICAVGFGALLTEGGKWAMLSLFLPLYTRLKKEELLDQPTRYKIYGYILGNPGAYFLLMREVLELGGGQLVYHLKQLEDAKLIYSRVDGAKKRFYPTHVPKPKRTSHLFSDIEEKIFGIIGNNSGINQKKIASEMGISRQVAGYHLTQMTRKGVINKKVVGRKTIYYPSEESSI